MKRRNQIATVLLVLTMLLFSYVVYSNYFRQPGAVVVATVVGSGFVPLPVENPALRTDLLDELKNFQYQGPRRNIFSTAAVPAPEKAQPAAAPPVAIAPPVQISGPAPLVVPATFFGHSTDRQSGQRRAFFSQGDEVYVLGLGEVLLNRFRLVQIGDTTAELEEVGSGRRTTVNMERPAS
jgi:hypothetical protein